LFADARSTGGMGSPESIQVVLSHKLKINRKKIIIDTETLTALFAFPGSSQIRGHWKRPPHMDARSRMLKCGCMIAWWIKQKPLPNAKFQE